MTVSRRVSPQRLWGRWSVVRRGRKLGSGGVRPRRDTEGCRLGACLLLDGRCAGLRGHRGRGIRMGACEGRWPGAGSCSRQRLSKLLTAPDHIFFVARLEPPGLFVEERIEFLVGRVLAEATSACLCCKGAGSCATHPGMLSTGMGWWTTSRILLMLSVV